MDETITVEHIEDHGTVVAIHGKDGTGKHKVIIFDHRPFAIFYEAEGPLSAGQVIYTRGAFGDQEVSCEPFDDYDPEDELERELANEAGFS